MMGWKITADPVLNGFYETPRVIRRKMVFFKKVLMVATVLGPASKYGTSLISGYLLIDAPS